MVYDNKPWLKSYDADVNGEIEIPDVSLKDALVSAFEEYAGRAAIQYMGMTMSFSELHEQSGRLARALTEKGLGKSDVMAIDKPNLPQ